MASAMSGAASGFAANFCIRCSNVQAPAAALEELAVRTRHMRFPVVDPAGRLVGYVHAKDLLHLRRSETGARVAPAVRPMPTITAETPLPEALNRTRGRREVQELTGNRWVPTLVLDDGTVIDDSKAIVGWARENPA